MAQNKGRAKKQKTAQQKDELKALQERPTRHNCASPKCHAPRECILQKDLQPAGLPNGTMSFFHKDCWKKL